MKKYIVLFCAAGLMVACGDEDPVVDVTPDVVDTTATDLVEVPPKQYFYQVPTPDELFAFIIEAGNKPKMELLNPSDNIKNYVTKAQQSLNFGIYSTDLVYASHYNQGQQTLDYFKVVNDLGNILNISAAFNETMKDRLTDNQDNIDSLLTISKDTYYAAYDYLEQNEQGAELSLVVTGGWIESLYIVSQTTTFKEGDPVITRIAEQKYSLENIVDFLGNFKEDAGVASTLQQLEALQAAFNAIEEKEVAPTTKTDGRPTLGGSPTKLVMSAKQFEALKTELAQVRNSFTGNNS